MHALALAFAVALGGAPDGTDEAAPTLAGRQAIALTLGLLRVGAESTALRGGVVAASAGAEAVGSVDYTAWLGDRWALEFSGGVLAADASASGGRGAFAADSAAVLRLLIGGRWYAPLLAAREVWASAGVSVGPVFGVASGARGVSGNAVEEARPGARASLGLDWFAARHLRLGLVAGYALVQPFDVPIGTRRDYSGFEAGVSVGVTWGGR